MKVLVSLLGKLQRDQRDGYRKVEYQFDDGIEPETAFLGWSLARRLQPDHLVIIGTATSMWEHLFDGDLDLADEAENRRIQLQELAEDNQPVPRELLEGLAPVLGKHLGCQVSLVITSRGLEAEAQMEMFDCLAQVIEPGDQVTIDCTHGFRHMPMLLLAGVQFLEGLESASVEAVYYGLLEPGSDRARVCRLDSLMTIQRGVRALSHFDASGDYMPLIDMLEGHLPEDLNAELLREAAFHERTLRITQARKLIRKFHQFLETSSLPFPLDMLRSPLMERLEWATKPSHHERQLAASRIALSRRDYPRAAALLFEAQVNRVVQEKQLGDLEKFEVREKARELLKDRIRQELVPSDIRILQRLRNAMAHGARPEGFKAQEILGSEEKLRQFLLGLIDELA